MRELIADLFISLDGFASGVNEAAFFGHSGQELANWVSEQADRPQLVLMGRVTYELLAGFSVHATDETSVRLTSLPKLVFSSTLEEPLVWKNTRLAKGGVAEDIGALKQQRGDALRSIGSISLVKSMMQLGLVDRFRLMVFPLILGSAGREPIFAAYGRTSLKLMDTTVLDSTLTLLEYRPAQGTMSSEPRHGAR